MCLCGSSEAQPPSSSGARLSAEGSGWLQRLLAPFIHDQCSLGRQRPGGQMQARRTPRLPQTTPITPRAPPSQHHVPPGATHPRLVPRPVPPAAPLLAEPAAAAARRHPATDRLGRHTRARVRRLAPAAPARAPAAALAAPPLRPGGLLDGFGVNQLEGLLLRVAQAAVACSS